LDSQTLASLSVVGDISYNICLYWQYYWP